MLFMGCPSFLEAFLRCLLAANCLPGASEGLRQSLASSHFLQHYAAGWRMAFGAPSELVPRWSAWRPRCGGPTGPWGRRPSTRPRGWRRWRTPWPRKELLASLCDVMVGFRRELLAAVPPLVSAFEVCGAVVIPALRALGADPRCLQVLLKEA